MIFSKLACPPNIWKDKVDRVIGKQFPDLLDLEELTTYILATGKLPEKFTNQVSFYEKKIVTVDVYRPLYAVVYAFSLYFDGVSYQIDKKKMSRDLITIDLDDSVVDTAPLSESITFIDCYYYKFNQVLSSTGKYMFGASPYNALSIFSIISTYFNDVSEPSYDKHFENFIERSKRTKIISSYYCKETLQLMIRAIVDYNRTGELNEKVFQDDNDCRYRCEGLLSLLPFIDFLDSNFVNKTTKYFVKMHDLIKLAYALFVHHFYKDPLIVVDLIRSISIDKREIICMKFLKQQIDTNLIKDVVGKQCYTNVWKKYIHDVM
jgi:hypothetical protein